MQTSSYRSGSSIQCSSVYPLVVKYHCRYTGFAWYACWSCAKLVAMLHGRILLSKELNSHVKWLWYAKPLFLFPFRLPLAPVADVLWFASQNVYNGVYIPFVFDNSFLPNTKSSTSTPGHPNTWHFWNLSHHCLSHNSNTWIAKILAFFRTYFL